MVVTRQPQDQLPAGRRQPATAAGYRWAMMWETCVLTVSRLITGQLLRRPAHQLTEHRCHRGTLVDEHPDVASGVPRVSASVSVAGAAPMPQRRPTSRNAT